MSKETLLKLAESKRKKEIVINGETYYVKELSAGEYATYTSTLYKQVGKNIKVSTENSRITLAILSLCDENLNSIFTMADFEAVANMPGRIIEDIAQMAEELTKSEEEAIKN